VRYIILCVLFAFPCVTFAQQPVAKHAAAQNAQFASYATQQRLSASLEARVRAAWEAFRKRDKDRYAEFLAGEFQAVEADGEGERSRARILLEVEHSMYTDYLLQLFQVEPLGPDYAFVTYEATIQFPAGSAARYKRIFIGELWILRNGEWKMMRYQETPVG
jgi:hypothetical protein